MPQRHQGSLGVNPQLGKEMVPQGGKVAYLDQKELNVPDFKRLLSEKGNQDPNEV